MFTRNGRVAAAFGLVLVLSSRAAAHDIPNDVTVRAFLRPEGQRLRLVVRAPLGCFTAALEALGAE